MVIPWISTAPTSMKNIISYYLIIYNKTYWTIRHALFALCIISHAYKVTFIWTFAILLFVVMNIISLLFNNTSVSTPKLHLLMFFVWFCQGTCFARN